MRTNILIAVVVIVVACIFVYYNSSYVLADDDQVVITQFGKVIGAKDVPGEYFKIPLIQKVHYITKNYLTEWEQQVPTSDRKFISLKTKAFWKINDPIRYYKKLNSYNLSRNLIIDHVGAVEREFIIANPLSALVGATDDKQLDDVECKHNISFLFKERAEEILLKSGISLNNVEARVTTPINMVKP